MNPIAVLFLVALFALVVFIGRSGAGSARVFFRIYGRKLIGLALLALAGLLLLRGLWEPALLPGSMGWLILNGGLGTSQLGRILKQYLDRRFPGFGHNLHGNSDPGGADSGSRGRTGVMTEQEAYQILGLQPGESGEAIATAYRTAMKKVHPDQGGTSEEAVRLNQARDFLLRRHH